MRLKGRIRKKSDLKKGQEDALDQKVYLEGIISSMTDALIVVNPDATLRSVNKAALDLLGYKEDDLIGQPIKKIFLQEEEEEEEEEELHKYFQKIIDEGVAYNTGLNFRTKQGKVLPINFSGAVMKQEGRIVGVVGVARDMRQIMAIISDLENKERELKERSKNLTRMQRAMLHIMGDLNDAKDDLGRALRIKTEFTGMVSHELRTPLFTIHEAVSMVLEKIVGNINEKQEKYLKIAKKNVDRVDRLISGVLSFQALESGKVKFKIEENDINEVVREIRQEMLPVAEKKDLSLVCQLDEDLPRVKSDRDKIIQVLTNLVSNALSVTDKGSITITTGRGENFIQVTVKDTGPGIKKEDMPKLFQQYVQLQKKVGGTGLGLLICKQIIEAHKGKIWAESEFGTGAVFHFILPIEEQRA